MAFQRILSRDASGATAIEYGLIAGLIALGLVGTLVGTRSSLSGALNADAAAMASATSGASQGPTFNPNNARASYWQAKGIQPSQPVYGQNANTEYWTYTFQDGSQAFVTKYKNSPIVMVQTHDVATKYGAQITYYNGAISGVYEQLYSDTSFSVSSQKYTTNSDTFDANGVPTNQRECAPVNGGCTLNSVPVTSAYKAMVATSVNDFALFLGSSVTPKP